MSILTQIQTLVGLFLEVALSDPLSLVLLGLGAVLVGGASAVFGYLAFRGIVAWIGGRPTAGPPVQGQ